MKASVYLDGTAPATVEIDSNCGATIQLNASAPAVIRVEAAGLIGPQGVSSTPVVQAMSALAGVDLKAGQVVYLNLTDKKAYPAIATATYTSTVAGLVQADTAAGFVASIAFETLSLPDWTVAAGGASLAVGDTYFVGLVPGALVVNPPTAQGQVVSQVGVASGLQSFVLRTFFPILL